MLDDSESFQTNEVAKLGVLECILQPHLLPALHGKIHHVALTSLVQQALGYCRRHNINSLEETIMAPFQIHYEGTPFLKTSETGAHLNRLNWRSHILLTRNREAIEGMRILDLASHDGRFSYACLKLGAAHVTGVEARPHLVANAVDNLSQSGFDPSSFAFMQGDVFDYLPKVQEGEYDTVLCFGVFYHTVRQIELLREIERIKPKYFILDTAIEKEVTVRRLVRHRFLSRLTRLILSIRPRHIARLSNSLQGAKRRLATSTEGQPCLVFRHEGVEAEGATIDSLELVAWPTQSFIEQFFEHFGYKSRQLNWDQNEIKDWTMMEDYEFGYRVSYLAEVLQKRTV